MGVDGTKWVSMEQKECHLGTFGVSVPYHPAHTTLFTVIHQVIMKTIGMSFTSLIIVIMVMIIYWKETKGTFNKGSSGYGHSDGGYDGGHGGKGGGYGGGHGVQGGGTSCVVKGSYCQCHYCKCEQGHLNCSAGKGGYEHEKGSVIYCHDQI